MNQGYAYKYSIVDEEPNANTTRFFDLLRNFDKLLWDGYTNHNKSSVVTQVFIINLDNGLSEADYDRIVK